VSPAAGLAVPVLAALAAAGAFGVAAALQHQQAGLARPAPGLSPRLLADVARRPRWLAGVALATAAYGLQAVALAYGPLTLVAPIVAADLLVALPLAARWSRRPLRARDWAGCLLVGTGVSVFLAAAPPSGERRAAPTGDWLTVLGIVALIVATALVISRGRRPALSRPAWLRAGSTPPRGPASTGPASTGPASTGPASTGPASTGPASTGPASTGPANTGSASTGRGGWFRAGALAAAAGVVFGLTAAVTASFTTSLRADGLRSLLAHWQPWALVVLGLTGILLSTAAFQAGALAASLPVIDTVEPVSGVIIGAVLFDERLATSAAGLVAQLGAATVAATGIAMLGPSLAAVQAAASRPAPAEPVQAAASGPAPAEPAPAASPERARRGAGPDHPPGRPARPFGGTRTGPAAAPGQPASGRDPGGPRPVRPAFGRATSRSYGNEWVCRSNGPAPLPRTAAGAVRARGGPGECDLLDAEGPPSATATEDRADQLPF
jgi:drug/metabolite transporter (DMT)-like permease